MAHVQAVLIEHDEVVLSDLSAVVVSGGRKGENLIKEYDQVPPPAHPLPMYVLHHTCVYVIKSTALLLLSVAIVHCKSQLCHV